MGGGKMTQNKYKMIHFYLFILVVFFTVFGQTPIIHAASLNLFGTTTASNNSQTSPSAPFLNEVNVPVNFLIEGSDSVSAGAITTGNKYAVMNIPSEMAGYIQPNPNGNATVQTTVTVPFSQSPVQPLMLTINTVVGMIDLALISNQYKTAIHQALDELESENFGSHELSMAITEQTPTQYSVEISDALLPILTETLAERVEKLQEAVTAVPLLGTILGTWLSTFTLSLSGLVNDLESPTSARSKDLVAASILGHTNVALPFLISSPRLTNDLTANFTGGFIQTDQVSIQLGGTIGTTPIYFSAGSLLWHEETLPNLLNFGQHQIQTQEDELFLASNNNQITTASLFLEDSRSITKNWQLKVQQLTPWQNNTNQLDAQLQLAVTDLTTTFPVNSLSSSANQLIQLSTGTQQALLQLHGVSEPGQVQLDIDQFRLAVPKESLKTIGTYSTTIEWILSDTP